MENKKIIIITIVVIVLVLIGLFTFTLYITSKANGGNFATAQEQKKQLEQLKTKLVPTTLEDLNGYGIKIGAEYFKFTVNNDKQLKWQESSAKVGSSYGFYGNTFLLMEDGTIPTLDLSNNQYSLVYKGQELPEDYKLRYLSNDGTTIAGILLDENNVVLETYTSDFTRDLVGYTCKVLDATTCEIKEGRVYLKDQPKAVKLGFTKGTLYKEAEVKVKALLSISILPYMNGEAFQNIQITNDSYGNVILNNEKNIASGYYMLYDDSTSSQEGKIRNSIVIKIVQKEEQKQVAALKDAADQLRITENVKLVSTSMKKITVPGILKQGIKINNVKFDDSLKDEQKTTKLAENENALEEYTLSKDYYKTRVDFDNSLIYKENRYFLATLKIEDYANVKAVLDFENATKYLTDTVSNIEQLLGDRNLLNKWTTDKKNVLDSEKFIGYYANYKKADTGMYEWGILN